MRRLLIVAALVAVPAAAGAEPDSPWSSEAFFGTVTADAPAGATAAKLFLGSRLAVTGPVSGRRVVFRLRQPPGLYDLRLRFERDGRLLRRDESRRVWLLPPSAARAVRERGVDSALAGRLSALGRAYPGYAALWVHDLASGRTAGWNSDASFPAASIAKLAVLIAALDRYGPRPERSDAWPLIRDLAVWSSNDASNQLLVRLGGSEAGGTRIANAVLRRLGAASSTFSGFYRLGTSAASDVPRPLPLLTYRRTTAHDVGRMLFELHGAAVGNGLSRRRTGLSRHEARVGLALLLSSDPRGDNAGLFRDAAGTALPMAQKNGWTTKLRHSAALVYGPSGPQIVVVLTFRSDRIDAAASLALGRRVLWAVFP